MKLKNRIAKKIASAVIQNPLELALGTRTCESRLSMCHPRGFGCCDDLDGVGADDVDDDDLGSGWQVALKSAGLVLGGAILEVERDLAQAAFVAGDREVDGSRLTDRA